VNRYEVRVPGRPVPFRVAADRPREAAARVCAHLGLTALPPGSEILEVTSCIG
jgi:hypothetical protein